MLPKSQLLSDSFGDTFGTFGWRKTDGENYWRKPAEKTCGEKPAEKTGGKAGGEKSAEQINPRDFNRI